jgi:CheY-like chemotaxis protein
VFLERVNSHVEIVVSDTGAGIAPEVLPHVFDRFWQADSSTTRRHGGLGLGLSIVKQLTELHGGSVRVKSPGLGSGTTFVVMLPLLAVHNGAPAHNEPRVHPTSNPAASPCDLADLTGLTVLVVDDEPDARHLVRMFLEECKASVITAASAVEALQLLAQCRPSVLISDIGMMETDGYDFIRQVRAMSPREGGRVPAIALTAFARSEDRTRTMLAGYNVHLSKPVEPAELIAAVASLAGRTG